MLKPQVAPSVAHRVPPIAYRRPGVQTRRKASALQATVSPATQQMLSGVQLGDDQGVRQSVQQYYGETLKTSADLKTSACCTAGVVPKDLRALLAAVPEEIRAKYYGCGSPLPRGIRGLRVLDLGCGSGRDCYVCSALVGEQGSVIGLDMTPAQLDVARRHVAPYTAALGYAAPNMRFVSGTIEDLASAGIADASVDVVISNCVINLSPAKDRVLAEVYRVLAPGGEMYFSDVYCDRRLPQQLRTHPVLLGECLGGALYEQDFLRLCRDVGFGDPRRLSSAPIDVRDEELQALLGRAAFTSATYRLFKLPGRLESLCEDYGQVAVYKGTVPGHAHAYELDDHHVFETGRPMLVCGNTASMVGETWLGQHFAVSGDRSVHFGLFDCAPAGAAPAGAACGPAGCC